MIVKIKLDDWAKKVLKGRMGFKLLAAGTDSLSPNDLIVLSLIEKRDGDTMDLTEEAGKLEKLQGMKFENHNSLILSPSNTRMIFTMKGWSNVIGFHTRNIPHRGHEYIMMKALKNTNADGLFIHPVICV